MGGTKPPGSPCSNLACWVFNTNWVRPFLVPLERNNTERCILLDDAPGVNVPGNFLLILQLTPTSCLYIWSCVGVYIPLTFGTGQNRGILPLRPLFISLSIYSQKLTCTTSSLSIQIYDKLTK